MSTLNRVEKVSHFSTPSFDHASRYTVHRATPTLVHLTEKTSECTLRGHAISKPSIKLQYERKGPHVTGQQPIRQRNSCDAGANEPIAVPNAVIYAGELGDSSRQPTTGRSFCRCSTRHHVNQPEAGVSAVVVRVITSTNQRPEFLPL
ncbi:hypothetical protein ACJJTC_014661 [Scirpophaga incertulas]